MRTGALVRRHRVATVVLGVLAGVAAAVPMATWAAGRRTSDTLDHFVSVSHPPDVLIDFCPAGVEPGSPDDLAACNAYVPSSEMETIRSMDGVRHAVRASWTMMLVAGSVDAPPGPATMIQLDEAPVATWSGDPVVVAGRLPDLDASDELLVSDGAAAALGIERGVGDLDQRRPGQGRAVRLDGRRCRAHPRRARSRAQRLSAGLGQPDVPRLRRVVSCARRRRPAGVEQRRRVPRRP